MSAMNIDVEALTKLVREATSSGSNPLPRITASIGNREGVLFEAASGVRIYPGSPDDSNNKVDMDSIFWLASQTKLITGLAAAQCIERGLFTLQSLAEDFVPELKELKILAGFDQEGNEILIDRQKKVTVRHLLTHCGGFIFSRASPDKHQRYRINHGLEDIWEGPTAPRSVITGMPHNAEPGEVFSYSHDNDWLAFTVEGATGMDFEDYCKQNIFQPLGIEDMFWRRGPEHSDRLVNLCMRKADGSGYEGVDIGGVLRPLACSGGGGCFGSARSYMKLLRTLLNDGVFLDNGARIIKKETWEMMCTPLIEDPKQQEGMWQYLNNALPLPSKHDDGFNLSCNLGFAIKIMLEDLPEGRRAGTVFGEGYACTYWLIDRKTGIVFTFMTEVAPGDDPHVKDFYAKFEKEIYRSLSTS